MNDIVELWKRTLGVPPTDAQFAIWEGLHTPEVMKRAILKTAVKNQQLNSTMSLDHRLRFASKVMLALTSQAAERAHSPGCGLVTWFPRGRGLSS